MTKNQSTKPGAGAEASTRDRVQETSRWEIVERWFHQLAPLQPHDRADALRELEQTDLDLHRQVVELLNSDRPPAKDELLAAGRLQDSALWEGMVHSLNDASSGGEPTQTLKAGPFTVGQELGRGGMAVVHLGERTDDDFQQVVAIKRLTGTDGAGLSERLLIERRILANLRHPNIAQLIDGGTDSTGQPFLALEYVEGLPIDEYCDTLRLGMAQRIELVLQACAAVQHAHSNLVVHQDLKPSNILVDQRGQVKLLDFGIAQLLDGSEESRGEGQEIRPLTPRYAAPEQFLGQSATTATDVYGLGLVLYELLVGRLPYRISGAEIDDYREAVLGQDPADPIAALNTLTSHSPDTQAVQELALKRSSSVRHLRRSLSGDLSAIFGKALHRNPARRYEGAAALADDLQRYLKHEPLQALSGTIPYRASKFLRRHRWPVAAATLILLSMGIGLVAALGQANRARQQAALTEVQRSRAEAERNRAIRVKEILATIIEGTGPGNDQTERLTPVEFLERGMEKVLPALEDDPDDMASILGEMSTIFRRLGYVDRASTLAQQVVDVRREIEGHPGQLSRALYHLALVERDRRNEDKAEAILKEILEIENGRWQGVAPKTLEVIDQRGYVFHTLGSISLRRDDLEEAERFYAMSIDHYRAEGHANDTRIPVVEGDLAFLLLRQGKYVEAQRRYEAVLATQREQLSPHDPRIAVVLNNLGRIELEIGTLDKAEAQYLEALAIDERAYGPNRPSQASELGWLGEIEMRRGKPGDALVRYRQAIATLRGLDSDEPRLLGAKSNLARAVVAQGELLGRPDALALAEEALSISSEILDPIQERWGNTHRRWLTTEFSRLRALRLVGREEEAMIGLQTLTETATTALGPDHALTLDCRAALEQWLGS